MPPIRPLLCSRFLPQLVNSPQLRCFRFCARLSRDEEWRTDEHKTLAQSIHQPAKIQYALLESPEPIKYTEAEVDEARAWLRTVGPNTIPKNEITVSMSRSSGPGGQNVNKVETKVTLRVPFSSIEERVPKMLHEWIKGHQWYAKNSDSLVIQCDGSRSRKANQNDAFQKLEGLLRLAGQVEVPAKMEEKQRRRVETLHRQADRRRKNEKKRHSSKKASRRSFDD